MFNIKEFLHLDYYESELDKFLADFSKKHPKLSASQREEQMKYQRIAEGLRYGTDMEGRAKE
jgi:AICAR transformylase/IMP cyclohydrolase PurH